MVKKVEFDADGTNYIWKMVFEKALCNPTHTHQININEAIDLANHAVLYALKESKMMRVEVEKIVKELNE